MCAVYLTMRFHHGHSHKISVTIIYLSSNLIYPPPKWEKKKGNPWMPKSLRKGNPSPFSLTILPHWRTMDVCASYSFRHRIFHSGLWASQQQLPSSLAGLTFTLHYGNQLINTLNFFCIPYIHTLFHKKWSSLSLSLHSAPFFLCKDMNPRIHQYAIAINIKDI